MREDPGLAIFGCTILRELNWYLKLPMSLSESTLFSKGHQQNYPLELRGTVFKKKLVALIEEMNEKIKNMRVRKPQTEDDKKYNKVLYNMKRTKITSMLRDHFKEMQFSKEQYAYFNGRFRIAADGYNVNFPIYHKTMTK